MDWQEDDIKDGLRISQDLQNPASILSLVQQSLVHLREREWDRAKRAKDPYEKFQAVGIVAGIDLAIAHPHNIVKRWQEEIERRRHER